MTRMTMSNPSRRMYGSCGVWLALCAAACGQEIASPDTASETGTLAGPAAVAGALGGPAPAVTLITGDRVTLLGSGQSVHVEPGPGRAQIGYLTIQGGGEITVIPDDMAPLIAARRVDRALFNITRLVAGSGDLERSDLPRNVTGLQAGAPANPSPAIAAEGESYDLTLRATDRDGAPSSVDLVVIPRHPDGARRAQFLTVDGELTVRLPRDAYALHTSPSEPDKPVYLAYPNLVLDHDTTVDLDDRLARPVDISVPGVSLAFGNVQVAAWDMPNGIGVRHIGAPQLFTAQLGPELDDTEFRSWIGVTAADPSAPDRYAFVHEERGHMATGWHETLSPGQFATVDIRHIGDAHSVFQRILTPRPADAFAFGSAADFDFVADPAVARRIYHLFGPAVRWASTLDQLETVPGGDSSRLVFASSATVRDYQPGQRYVERWNHAPFGPALAEHTGRSAASRLGDLLTISPSMFSDRASPPRSGAAFARSEQCTLRRNGAPFVAGTPPGMPLGTGPLDAFAFCLTEVPPDAATYRYEQEATRGPNPLGGPDIFDLSTHVSAAWTFRSAHVTGQTPAILPLPTLRFQPELDDDNRATSRVIVLPVAIERPVGAATPRIERVTVDVSFDDGTTWTAVPGALRGDRWFGIVVHPAGAAYASLRGTVRDVAGNAGEVTIIHAYRLAAATR